MSMFRKKPVVIEARRLLVGSSNLVAGLALWCDGSYNYLEDSILIRTLEGSMIASPGDWIIKGIEGEFYPCKPHIFAATYEPAATLHEQNEDRRFPMQRGPSIPWALAEIIYAGYSAMYGTQQSLERLAARGGFSWREVEVMYNDTADSRGRHAMDKADPGRK